MSPDGLERDDIVYYCPQDARDGGKNRVATATVYMGQEAEATIVSVRDGYGFLQVVDQRGNQQDVFFSLAEVPDGIVCGEMVTCQIVETARGVRAEGIERRPPVAKAA